MEKSLVGCIIGTAVGDALGLPFEGMKKKRIMAKKCSIDRYYFCGNIGMVSDDTEHTILLAESLLLSKDMNSFLRHFAWRLRLWFLALPAGIGYATARAIGKLWLGFSPQKSGVFSAGNGTAMRSAILGILYGSNHNDLCEWLKANSYITHTDEKAFLGSLAIALAAYQSSLSQKPTADHYFSTIYNIECVKQNNEFYGLLQKIEQSLQKNETFSEFLESINCSQGISGYVYHTFPAVIHSWLRNTEDYPNAMEEAILAGGDTDTTAAILGAIIGARIGKDRIPKAWQKKLWEYPKGIDYMEKLALALAHKKQDKPFSFRPKIKFFRTLIRNILFLIIVLLHGFRRLLPPY